MPTVTKYRVEETIRQVPSTIRVPEDTSGMTFDERLEIYETVLNQTHDLLGEDIKDALKDGRCLQADTRALEDKDLRKERLPKVRLLSDRVQTNSAENHWAFNSN